MSGFFCIAAALGQEVSRELLDTAAARMAYRGIDRQQVAVCGNVGFATSSTDVGDGSTTGPVRLGDLWAVGDVRIDDRARLLRELHAAGEAPAVGCDHLTLLLHAWRAWGADLTKHIIGDFAFVIFDAATQTILAARDQIGVAPLYRAGTRGMLVLSNTLAAVRAMPGIGTTLNEDAVVDYLMFSVMNDTAASFFRDIGRIPPAHQLEWRAGSSVQRRYWEPPEPRIDASRSDAEVLEEFRIVMRNAVADRMTSPKIGIMLSGGLDSMTVAATAAELIEDGAVSAELRAWTCGYDWLLAESERSFASDGARALGIRHETFSAEPFMLDPARAWHITPEPRRELRRSPETAIPGLAEAAGFRHLLTGFGGDPAFGTPAPNDWRNPLRALRRRLRALTQRRRPLPPVTAPLDPELAARTHASERWRESLLLNARLRGHQKIHGISFWSEALSTGDPGYTGWKGRLQHPFFDLRLLAFLDELPAVPWRARKGLLRRFLDARLPESVVHRPKTHLGADPFHALAIRGLEPGLAEWVTAPELAGLVDTQAALSALQQCNRIGAPEYRAAVLRPVSLARWLHTLHSES